MKKFMLIIIIILFLCGCSANIQVEISKDGSVNEKVIISQENFSNAEEVADNYIDIYKDTLESEDYEYLNESTDNTSKVVISKEYLDICDYFSKSIFIKDQISDLSCKKENNIYKILFNFQSFECVDDCLEGNLYDDALLTIKLPTIAVYSNADEVEGNSYVWRFTGNELKRVNLELKNSDLKGFLTNGKGVIYIVVFSVIIILLIVFILIRKHKMTKIDY